MQLFIPSEYMSVSAAFLDDRRLNKQIVECAQIASTAIWINNCGFGEYLTSIDVAYLPTHEHHPLCRWAAENIHNILYCCELGLFCAWEYGNRFDKVHNTFIKLLRLMSHIKFTSEAINNTKPKSPQPNCTTNHKHITNINESYRKELELKWKTDKIQPKWTIGIVVSIHL